MLGKWRAFRKEEREEDAVWRSCRKFREDSRHVRVALLNSDSDRDLAAERAEFIAKRGGKTRGVRVAVVYGHHAPPTQFTVCEVGDRLPLIKVVVSRAEIAGVVVGARIASEVGCEYRRCVGRRDHHQTCFADQR